MSHPYLYCVLGWPAYVLDLKVPTTRGSRVKHPERRSWHPPLVKNVETKKFDERRFSFSKVVSWFVDALPVLSSTGPIRRSSERPSLPLLWAFIGVIGSCRWSLPASRFPGQFTDEISKDFPAERTRIACVE